jgi:hypothetical protein
MAEKKTQAELVSELAMSTAFQLEAIIRLLERKGMMTRDEILAEVAELTGEQRNKSNGAPSRPS